MRSLLIEHSSYSLYYSMKFDVIFYVKSILPDDNNISIIIIITRIITMSNKYVLTLFVSLYTILAVAMDALY